MKRHKRRSLTLLIGLVSLITALAGSLAFAALQSQQNTLVGNTIETATANLQLSTDGVSYSNSHPGFDFNNLIPGGPAVPTAGYSFYLKNAGGTPLSLKFAVNSLPENPSNVDLSKVNVILTTVGSGSSPQTFSLQSLVASSASGGVTLSGAGLSNGTSQLYKLQVSMASDAVTGSSASLGNIDFVFSGQAQTN